MTKEIEGLPFAYRHKDLTDRGELKRWKGEMSNGKIETVTKTHKTKLPTAREYDVLIKKVEDILEQNEADYKAKKITGTVYEETRAFQIQNLHWLKEQRAARENLIYLGQQKEFKGYLPDLVDRPKRANTRKGRRIV